MSILSNPIYLVALIGCIFLLLVLLTVFHLSRHKEGGLSIDPFEHLYQRIHEDIKYAVAPKSMQLSVGATELVELATEVWRIEQRIIKVADTLPENQKKGLENSVHKLKTYVAKYDVEIIDYTGKKFNDGLNLDILHVDKDSSVEFPTVKETVEPTILVKGQVVKKAKIILLSN